jgi:hypothetical protein
MGQTVSDRKLFMHPRVQGLFGCLRVAVYDFDQRN